MSNSSENLRKKVDASRTEMTTEMDATQTPSPLALAKLTGALALRRARAMVPEVKMSIRHSLQAKVFYNLCSEFSLNPCIKPIVVTISIYQVLSFKSCCKLQADERKETT